MHVVGCQLDIVWEDKAASHQRLDALLEGAADKVRSGSLIVLPEMFATGFSMDLARNDDRLSRTSLRYLIEKAQAGSSFLAGASIAPTKGTGLGENVAVLVKPTARLTDGYDDLPKYTKIFPIALLGEDRCHRGGDSLLVFEHDDAKIAAFICYDLRFPEIFRAAVIHHKAEVLVVMANFPSVREDHWVSLLQARAIENQAYVIGVNRCGKDPELEYPGRSMIIDPWGKIVSDAGSEEGVIEAELDLPALREYRSKLGFVSDAKPDWIPSIANG